MMIRSQMRLLMELIHTDSEVRRILRYESAYFHDCMCLCVLCMLTVVEVNVVDTSANQMVEDVTFPRQDLTRQSSWSAGGDSIRLTGDTIRELGADG